MNTTQIALIILASIVAISILLVIYLIFRFGKKSAYFFDKLFSQYNLTFKKQFYMAALYDEVYDFLTRLEIRNEIRLSEEAKQLLILPIIEVQRINSRSKDIYFSDRRKFDIDFNYWRESVEKILENIKNEPARIDREETIRKEERTSISVIKAYADKFCNIPPFCGER